MPSAPRWRRCATRNSTSPSPPWASSRRAPSSRAELTRLTGGRVLTSPELHRLRQRRAELGLPARDDAPLLIDPQTGDRVATESIPLHLRRARVTRAGIEANTSICSGMFKFRY